MQVYTAQQMELSDIHIHFFGGGGGGRGSNARVPEKVAGILNILKL